MTATEHARELGLVAANAAANKIATDIVLIDVSDRLAITDVFVIVTGSNERQVEAIVDEVEEQLRRVDAKPLRREGRREGRWVLLDYGDIVVHVQHAVGSGCTTRWNGCGRTGPTIPFDARPALASEDQNAC
jgi:ribosome-associated protein